jgi:hypothetical protein
MRLLQELSISLWNAWKSNNDLKKGSGSGCYHRLFVNIYRQCVATKQQGGPFCEIVPV